MSSITPETLEVDLERCTQALLGLARNSAWNPISNDCLYIVSEINNEGALWERWERRIIENRRKRPQPLALVMTELLRRFNDLYDINLFIYKAQRKRTIVDIRYFPKSSLPPELQEQARSSGPMLHAKVAIPSWMHEKTERFDIHWEYQPWRTRWHMFWARLRAKR